MPSKNSKTFSRTLHSGSPKMLKVDALYCRVSTDVQIERGESIDTQKARLLQYANGKGLNPKVYIDAGFSAKDTNRPAIRQLMADIREEKVSSLVVTKLDRISRNLKDLLDLLSLLEEHKVSFQSLDHQIDTSTAFGRAMLEIMGALGGWERRNTADRVRIDMHFRASNGKWNGGIIPYGFRNSNKSLIPDPKEAKLTNEIFAQYASMKNLLQTTEHLNKAGHRTRKGSLWTTTSISRLLTNPVYIGELVYNKRGVHTSGKLVKQDRENWIRASGVPAIVEKPLFERVQKILAEKRIVPLRQKSDFLLSGILYCAKCGVRMRGHSCEGKYRNYRCYKGAYYGKAYKCSNLIKAEVVEGVVVNTLFALLKNQPMMDQKEMEKRYKLRFASQNSSSGEVSFLERESENLRRQIDRLINAISEDDFVAQAARPKINELGKKLKEVEAALEEKKALNTGETTYDFQEFFKVVTSFETIWQKATLPQKKEIIRRVFSKISFRGKDAPLAIEGRSVFMPKGTHGHPCVSIGKLAVRRFSLEIPIPQPHDLLPEPKNFAQKVRFQRVKMGLRQEDLAERLGVTEDTVRGWEIYGRRPINKQTISRVQAFLTNERNNHGVINV